MEFLEVPLSMRFFDDVLMGTCFIDIPLNWFTMLKVRHIRKV